MHSHSISSFCQRLDHKIFIILSPSLHRHTRGQVHDVSNVVLDIHFLSAFIMQGDGTKCQRLEDSSDVDLWPTGRANVKPLHVKVDEFLYELEDLITRRWNPR